MDKKPLLSIIIPHYREQAAEVFPLLASIHNQLGIDFQELEVIIVNDAGDLLPVDFLKLFSHLNLSMIASKVNGGPGAARQIGIDAAAGEYLMFADADDVFHNVGVIGTFFDEIRIHQPDIVVSNWLEELLSAGRMEYLLHEDEFTWMHGKAVKKSFLTDCRIRFHETLRCHEDSYFLSIAAACTRNIIKIPVVTYVWKWRDQSITRRNDGEYTYRSIPIFNEAIGKSMVEIEKKGFAGVLPEKTVQVILYNYCMLQGDHWNMPERKSFKREAEKSIADHLGGFCRQYFKSELVPQIYAAEISKNPVVEKELLTDWMKRIGLHI